MPHLRLLSSDKPRDSRISPMFTAAHPPLSSCQPPASSPHNPFTRPLPSITPIRSDSRSIAPTSSSPPRRVIPSPPSASPRVTSFLLSRPRPSNPVPNSSLDSSTGESRHPLFICISPNAHDPLFDHSKPPNHERLPLYSSLLPAPCHRRNLHSPDLHAIEITFVLLAAVLALSLLSHHSSLLVLLSLIAWCFLYLLCPVDPPLVILGRTFSNRETLGALVVFLTFIGSLLISALMVGATRRHHRLYVTGRYLHCREGQEAEKNTQKTPNRVPHNPQASWSVGRP